MGTTDFYWFRYPYLYEGNTREKRDGVRAFLYSFGYKIAQVTLYFWDWEMQDAYTRCLDQANAASIATLEKYYLAAAIEDLKYKQSLAKKLLGHDIPQILLIHVGSMTADMTDRLLSAFEREHVRFISLPEAYQDPVYRQNPDVISEDAGSFLNQIRISKGVNWPKPAGEPKPDLAKTCLKK